MEQLGGEGGEGGEGVPAEADGSVICATDAAKKKSGPIVVEAGYKRERRSFIDK